MNKLKALAAAAVVSATMSAPAMAAYAPGSDFGYLDNTNVTFQGAATGVFTHNYTFDLANPGSALGGVFDWNVPGILAIAGLNVSLNKAGGGYSQTDTDLSNGFFFAGVPNGSYTFTVGGTGTGMAGGAYSGSIGAVTAVPEPQAIALALAGLGLIAAFRRTSRRSDAR